MDWSIATVIGGLGGLEFFRWLFSRKRIARADEFKILRETNEFLQKQLQAKEERFAEQTTLLRQTQRELLESAKHEAEKDIAHAQDVAALRIKLAEVRCDDEYCPFREPPGAKTPPRAGLSKEEYARKRILPRSLKGRTAEVVPREEKASLIENS